MGGGSNYHGDLAYNIVPKETKFSGGAFFKYNFNEFWSIRPTISYMQISGSDQNFKEYEQRNLSFRNNIYEFSNIFEFNFQPFSQRSIHKQTTFYTLLGIGLYKHKPEAEFEGNWYDLHKLNTENLTAKNRYQLFQINIPFGVGVKHQLSRNLILGFETGWRKTFTDHLDDVSTFYPNPNAVLSNSGSVSQRLSDRSWEVSETGMPLANEGDMRGDPNLKDWYFQAAFSISYLFTPIVCPF